MVEEIVVSFFDVFVAKARMGDSGSERFENGEYVSLGFHVSDTQVSENENECHYSEWEDNDLEEEFRPDELEDIDVDDIFGGGESKSFDEDSSSREHDEDSSLNDEEDINSVDFDGVTPDPYLNFVHEEYPGFEFKDCLVEEDGKEGVLVEPPPLVGSMKQFSWSNREWYDIKNPGKKFPQVVDCDVFPESRALLLVDKHKKNKSYGNWFSGYLDFFRRDYNTSYNYGFVRVGDILFKICTPLRGFFTPGTTHRQFLSRAIAYIVPIEKNGLHAYCLLPHDRIFFKEIDFFDQREHRINFNLDNDLVERYSIFSKSRMTQYFLGVTIYGIKNGNRLKICIVPRGKKCDFFKIPYMEILKDGEYGSMLDVGFPPFWNRVQDYDLIFWSDDKDEKIQCGGYVKFWFTHLFHGTVLNQPSVYAEVSPLRYYIGGPGVVVNPLDKRVRNYSSGYTSQGFCFKNGRSLSCSDFKFNRSVTVRRRKYIYFVRNYEFSGRYLFQFNFRNTYFPEF